MNIQQAEQATGISRQNIRFYERQGLLCPRRGLGNAYRQYAESDIRTLKQIKMLRMLDMPLEEVRAVLAGTLPLPQAAARQQQRLEARQAALCAAIRFCGTLEDAPQNMAQLDVDDYLARMEAEAAKGGYFMQWLEDYKKVAAAEHARTFSFEPEEDIHGAREFTNVLLAYGNAQKLDLVITQEGSEPLFTVDGVEYRAQKYYHYFRGIPIPAVRCEMTHPELYEPTDIPAGRRRLQRFLHLWLPGLVVMAIYAGYALSVGGLVMLTSPLGWLLLLSLFAVIGGQYFYYVSIHYNDGGTPRRK